MRSLRLDVHAGGIAVNRPCGNGLRAARSTIVCSRSRRAAADCRGVNCVSIRERRLGRAVRRAGSATTLLGYLALTKPRVIELLLVTTIPAMLLADRGTVDPLLILNTLVGGMLAAGGRQHAELRGRRRHRQGDEAHRAPAAGPGHGAAQPRAGVRAGAVGRLVLLAVVDHQPALGASGRRDHRVLRASSTRCCSSAAPRRTWCGAARPGCMPVMIGWSAVTGTIGWQALVMFAIIFFWTPPHTWALAMRYKDDYARRRRADAARGGHRAAGHQADRDLHLADGAGHAGAGPWPPAGCTPSVAVLAGAWFLTMAHQLYAGVRRGEPVKPLRLFLQSNNYLAVRVLRAGGRLGARRCRRLLQR